MAAGLHLLQSQQVLIVSLKSGPEEKQQGSSSFWSRPQDISTVMRRPHMAPRNRTIDRK
jgi:hypothetical protein